MTTPIDVCDGCHCYLDDGTLCPGVAVADSHSPDDPYVQTPVCADHALELVGMTVYRDPYAVAEVGDSFMQHHERLYASTVEMFGIPERMLSEERAEDTEEACVRALRDGAIGGGQKSGGMDR